MQHETSRKRHLWAFCAVVPQKHALLKKLKSENKPDCGIDCVAIEVAISQSIIDLREHEPGVSLKLRRKSPIDGE